MSATWPLVTVFTPAHNHGPFLRETVRSVLDQRYPNLDYLIIDDGSTDDTPEILKEFGDGIRVMRQPNAGEIRTVNRGLREARGELIIMINDDDTLLPGMIHAAVGLMQSHPDVLMCYPDFIFIDEHSQPFGQVQCRPYDYEFMVRTWGCLPGPGVCLRRKAIQLEPDRDIRYEYVGDFEYWLRLGLHGPFARLPGIYSTHRMHGTSKQEAHNLRFSSQILELAYEFFRRPNLPPNIRALEREAMSAARFEAAMRFPIKSRRRNLGLIRSMFTHPTSALRRIRDRSPSDGPLWPHARFLCDTGRRLKRVRNSFLPNGSAA